MHAASLSSVATASSVTNPFNPLHRHSVQPSQERSRRQPLSLHLLFHRHPLRSQPSNAANLNNVATLSSAHNPQRPQHPYRPQRRHNVQPSQKPSRRQPLSLHLLLHRHPLRSHPSNAADMNNAATLSNANNPQRP